MLILGSLVCMQAAGHSPEKCAWAGPGCSLITGADRSIISSKDAHHDMLRRRPASSREASLSRGLNAVLIHT